MRNMDETLARVQLRADELRHMLESGQLGADYGKFAREYSELEPVVAAIAAWKRACADKISAEALLQDAAGDTELRNMAEEELRALKAQLPILERELQLQLLPKDEADARNAILEIRPAAGGDEAGLFAAVLFDMYRKFAARNGWSFEVLSFDDNGLGGVKEASAMINGRGVFARLKFESGVHRVQRVPITEAQGRIHTSTATVAVLPEAEDVDIKIEEKDLRIDVYRASGAGGQHVNKTESAVRITHLPTGVAVAMQEERSQHKNRDKAMKILRSRLYEAQRQKQDAAYAAERKDQVGTGDRSERIRTYNYPQNRVTDHRVNLSVHNIEEVVAGGKSLDELVDALLAADQATKLATLL